MPGPMATDSNFERTFADLAYARLRDKAPTLLDYLIGFQLIDKNEEETHAIGVFGFKVGKEWVYCPVFFINGELKGHELMYIKNQDAFVPMMEQWVNYILNRRPRVLGELESTPRNRLGLRQPDFDIFARTPYIGSKYASAQPSYNSIRASIEKHAPEFEPFMDVFLVSPKHEKFASLETSFTLPAALKCLGKQAAVNLFETMKKDEKFAEAILKNYDIKDLVGGAYAAKSAAELDEISMKQRAGNELTIPKTMVITRGDDGTNVEQDMTDEEKKRILREQYIVRDSRTSDQKTRLYKSQIASTLNSPFETGFYDLMTPRGDTKRVLVLRTPIPIGYGYRRRDPVSIVVDTDGKKFGAYANNDLLTSKWYGKEELYKYVEGLPKGSSLKNGDKAFLINSCGESTGVFRVTRKTNHSEGGMEIAVYGDTSFAPSSSMSNWRKHLSPASDHMDDEIRAIVFTGKDGKGFTQIGETMFVPNDYKAMVLANDPDRYVVPSEKKTTQMDFGAGNWNDLLMGLHKESASGKTAELQLRTDGIRFIPVINGAHGPRLSKIAAIKYLIEKQGLDQQDAEMLVKDAQPRKAETYWIKYAYGEPPTQATFNEPNFGDEYGVRAPVQYPQTEIQNLGQNDNLGARELYRNDRYLDDDAKRYATQAAGQGQKEVLDTSVITGLVKTLDTDNAVDSYISDLMLGLDRIGRILFLYYWHNEKFKDRYGSQDMAEMEDNLRNVFKNLGELTLYLKQKTVEPEQMAGSDVKLTDVVA